MASSGHLPLCLRRATNADAERLFEWVNDPVTRRMSFDERAITWADHVAWLEARLSDARCLFYVALEGDVPIGQIRFDLPAESRERTGASAIAGDAAAAVVSLSIAPGHRGRGLAVDVIRLAAREVAKRGVRRVHAFIKPENAASLGAFERAGFAERSTVDRGQGPIIRLALGPGDGGPE